jgi:hypothetical protein
MSTPAANKNIVNVLRRSSELVFFSNYYSRSFSFSFYASTCFSFSFYFCIYFCFSSYSSCFYDSTRKYG